MLRACVRASVSYVFVRVHLLRNAVPRCLTCVRAVQNSFDAFLGVPYAAEAWQACARAVCVYVYAPHVCTYALVCTRVLLLCNAFPRCFARVQAVQNNSAAPVDVPYAAEAWKAVIRAVCTCMCMPVYTYALVCMRVPLLRNAFLRCPECVQAVQHRFVMPVDVLYKAEPCQPMLYAARARGCTYKGTVQCSVILCCKPAILLMIEPCSASQQTRLHRSRVRETLT